MATPCFAVLAVLGATTIADAAGAVRASSPSPITLQRAIAEPISGTSACTVEPKDGLYGNDIDAYDPTSPVDWFGRSNIPSTDDVIRDAQAGANKDLCIGFGLPTDTASPSIDNWRTISPTTVNNPNTIASTGDDMRDNIIDLPAGMSGNLSHLATCSDADFGYDGADTSVALAQRGVPVTCPDNTVAGIAVVRLSTTLLNTHVLVGGPDLTGGGQPDGMIYNLTPGPNELGRLGVAIVPAGLGGVRVSKFQVHLVLSPDGSGRVRSVVTNAPRQMIGSGLRNIYIENVFLRMWGAAADHPADSISPALNGDFIETPTQCASAVSAHVDVTTYGTPPPTTLPSTPTTPPVPTTPPAPEHSAIDSPGVTYTGCDALPFVPSVNVTTTEQRPGVPTGVNVNVHIDQTKAGDKLPSLLKDAVVTLPAGVEVGAQVASDADGLTFCAPGDFAASDVTTPAACPAPTQAGSVSITTPLISRAFTGAVYLGQPGGGRTLPDLYVEATIAGATAPDAPRIKLVGETTVDASGRITATFRDAPQLRFSELQMSFPGGPNALFSTGQRCGTLSAESRLLASARSSATVATSSVTLDQGCSAAAPTLTMTPTDATAGKKAGSKIVIQRPSGGAWLGKVDAHLPSGFLADISSAPECSSAAAATGACPAATQIGTVKVLAGAGDQTLTLTGKMYLSERQGTDVAGAVIVVPAKIGDLDLGDVVVRGRILLRPTDAGLDFITDVPTRVKGLAVQMQRVEVDLNRPNFALNPTACGPLAYSGDLTDDQGSVSKPAGEVTYTGCKDRSFAPKLKAILTGDNTPGGHPGMYVVLTSPEGDSGLKTAAVTLPEGVTTDGLNIKNACSPAAFAASSCPASTRIGSATADVSIIPEAITGDIYLVTVAGKALPGLGLDFKGRYAQRVLGNTTTDKQSRIVTTFPTIPDLPLRKLVIDVASGPKAPLLMSENEPCANGSSWQGMFTGQGGQASTSTTGLQCAATPKTSLSAKSGLSLRLFDFGTRKLKYLKLTLPKGWSFNAKAAKKADGIWVRLTGGTGTIKLGKRALVVTASGEPTDVRLAISGSAIRHPKKVKKGTKFTVPLRLAFTDGAIQEQQLSLTAK